MPNDLYTLRATYRKDNLIVKKIESKVSIDNIGYFSGQLIKEDPTEKDRTVSGQISILREKARIYLYTTLDSDKYINKKEEEKKLTTEQKEIKQKSIMFVADLRIGITVKETDLSGIYMGSWNIISYDLDFVKNIEKEMWNPKNSINETIKSLNEKSNTIDILLLKL